MAHIHQTGIVPTLHRLKPDGIERFEADLERFARKKLVLLDERRPCRASAPCGQCEGHRQVSGVRVRAEPQQLIL